MDENKKYINYTWFILVMVLLVILAGGVVRMTQSGMGCPDWPKCFGRWIPPTDASQLPPDFEKYLKTQDIDHSFNVYHTWIEYINRLFGAVLGVFIFIHFVWSFKKFRKTNRPVLLLSLFLLLAVGFQGWLGKKVVDANLAVVKVTIHMLVALLIAAIPLMIISRLNSKEKIGNKLLMQISTILIVVLLLQVVLGTQVREQIDEISKPLGYGQRELWIARLDNSFFIHRSFSWLVFAGSLFLCWKGWVFPGLRKNILLVAAAVIAVIIIGLIMAFADIPAWAQPLHLMMASILVLAIFSFRLKLK
ncbi:MAG TPA: COX15/CtaA family protein [Chitinophagaceae bacterium]|jgi:cytochrome c oxidase assembly protein subunit 15|nr:COX15/CtaA family protein [Chitinophagaceae bacterium]